MTRSSQKIDFAKICADSGWWTFAQRAVSRSAPAKARAASRCDRTQSARAKYAAIMNVGAMAEYTWASSRIVPLAKALLRKGSSSSAACTVPRTRASSVADDGSSTIRTVAGSTPFCVSQRPTATVPMS